MKEQEPIPEKKKLPLEDSVYALFELERQIALGNISPELLEVVAITAFNGSWSSDTIKQ